MKPIFSRVNVVARPIIYWAYKKELLLGQSQFQVIRNVELLVEMQYRLAPLVQL